MKNKITNDDAKECQNCKHLEWKHNEGTYICHQSDYPMDECVAKHFILFEAEKDGIDWKKKAEQSIYLLSKLYREYLVYGEVDAMTWDEVKLETAKEEI